MDMENSEPQPLYQRFFEALRSCKTQQGEKYLHYVQGGVEKVCALGVACKEFHEELGVERRFIPSITQEGDGQYQYKDVRRNGEFDWDFNVLPGTIRDALNFRTHIGSYGPTHDESIMGLNDRKGLSFQKIADCLEQNVATLLVAATEEKK